MPVFAKMPAMIAPEADDGVVGYSGLLQRLQQQIHLRIDIRDARRIAVEQFTLLGFRNGTDGGDSGVVPQFARVWNDLRLRRTAERRQLIRGKRKRSPIIQVPVFFRRNEGQVRFHKTHGKEERLRLPRKVFDLPHRGLSHRPVEIGVFGNVLPFRRWSWFALVRVIAGGLAQSPLCFRILVSAHTRAARGVIVPADKRPRP